MKKSLVIIFILVISCKTNSETTGNNKRKSKIDKPRIVEVKGNSMYPYAHINGFKDFEILKSDIVKSEANQYLSELRFNATYSSFYTKKVMYERYGLWDEVYRVKNEKIPILIWNNIDLFDDGKLYTIYASGFENRLATGNQPEDNTIDRNIFHTQVEGSNHSIYASVYVVDSNNNDCLTNNNILLRDSVVNFFAKGIKELTKSDEFYDVYRKAISNK